MISGSAIYNDLENYPTGNAACRTAVLKFLSGWTSELHQRGYVAGVYAQLYSGAADLAGVYGSASYARPDALWIARYDSNPALTGWAGIPNSDWSDIQRAKQYRGGHDETYGGVTLNIDNDKFNGPAATVPYSYSVTSTSALNARSGPASSYPVTGSYAPGSALSVSCQAPGQKIVTTSVWDKLTNGSYVTDYYVSTRPKPATAHHRRAAPTRSRSPRPAGSASAPDQAPPTRPRARWPAEPSPGSPARSPVPRPARRPSGTS